MAASAAFNVGRFRERRLCACSQRAPGPGSCNCCGLLLPEDISGLTLTQRLALLEVVPLGSALTLFGHEFVWSRDHARPAEVAQWRSRVDTIADSALAALIASDGTRDAADALEAASARGSQAAAALLACAELPPWVDADRVTRGGHIWFLYAPVLGPALLNLSLLGGYGASAINAVLVNSGGLLGSRDAVHRRITRTLQFVNDVASAGSLARGERGWRACLDVRLLHARVRANVRSKSSASALTVGSCPLSFSNGPWDEAALGAPVNGGDVTATQLAFSLVMLMGAERAGLTFGMSDTDVGDVLHWWGAVGALLGAPTDTPRLNGWARTGDVRGAQVALESLVAVLAAPGPSTRPLVLASVRAVAWRAPFFWSPSDHVAVTAAFAGAPYAAALGLPALDDAALCEPIDDAAPTTAFTSECAHINCTALHLTIDARRHGSARSFVSRALARVFFALARSVCALCAAVASLRALPGDTAAVTRGRALLAPLCMWPALVRLLPSWLRAAVAARAEAGLSALVAVRLQGRAPYAW